MQYLNGDLVKKCWLIYIVNLLLLTFKIIVKKAKKDGCVSMLEIRFHFLIVMHFYSFAHTLGTEEQRQQNLLQNRQCC